MSCNSKNYCHDVIVIGSGLSGMVAAYTILKHVPSLDVIILEANARIGGRILTVPLEVDNGETYPFDLGAQWVSSTQTHLIKLITSLNLTLVPQFKDGYAIADTSKGICLYNEHPLVGNVYTIYELTQYFATLEEKCVSYECSKIRTKYANHCFDTITMEQYIKSKLYTNTARDIARNLIRMTCGVEPAQISLLYYLIFCNTTLGVSNQHMNRDGGAREFFIQEGAEEICRRLKNKIGSSNIILSDPVVKIDYRNDKKVIITTASGDKYICSYLISAIPPEMISQIRFQPPLNKSKQKALQQIQTGYIIKFVITYKRAFWRAQGYSGEILCAAGPINMCYDTTKNGHPALTGHIKEQSLRNIQNVSYRQQVIRQLIKYWGNEAKNPIDYVEWVNECVMNCPGVGTLHSYNSLITQPLNRIYWAGAETATEWTGYMNGAVQAGIRTAIEILYELRPQSLTYRDITLIDVKRTHRIRFKKLQLLNKYMLTMAVIGGYILYKLLKYNNYI